VLTIIFYFSVLVREKFSGQGFLTKTLFLSSLTSIAGVVMKKKWASIILLLVLFSLAVTLPYVGIVKAQSIIYITADGTVEGTDKIQRDGNNYTFTNNISGEIVLDKSAITINGNGFTLTGDGNNHGFYLSHINDTIIKNVTIESCNSGFYLSLSLNNTITGNTVTGNNVGIYLRASKNTLITENNVLNNDQIGICCFRSENDIITNNVVTNNGGNGIEFQSSTMNCYVSDNEILNSGLNGIKLDWASNTTITGNEIQNSGENGIRVYESRNNTISKNNIDNNKANGIYLQTYSFLNLIFLNNITSNSEYGINNNKYSSNNLIHHNNFVDNGNQATTYPGETNTWGWDNGFPSGGNYWSDYDGQDNNEDGIGDTPYIIDENNQDNHPLMNPVDISTIQEFSTIPEFPSWAILPLLLVASLVAVLCKQRLTKNTKTNRSFILGD